ncbi:MAG: hypothetical protein AAGC53_14335 [Actinomycetota bacterium]
MIPDDELRSRLGAMAEQAAVADVTLESVQARGRRRTLYQRGATVLGAFALVVGGTVAVTSFSDDEANSDLATDAVTETEMSESEAEMPETEADDDDPARAEGDGTAAVEMESFEGDLLSTDDGSLVLDAAFEASEIVPWGAGFLRLTNNWDAGLASLPTAAEFATSDVASVFPQQILDVFLAAGDASVLSDEVADALADAGLEEEASAIVEDDPALTTWMEDLLDRTFDPGAALVSAAYSDDGETWTSVENFFWPDEIDVFSEVESNGEVLAVLVNGSVYAADRDVGDLDIRVYTTTDLVNWTETVVPIERPDAPPYLTVDVSAGDIVLGENAWYLPVLTWSWIDVEQSLPADVRAEISERGYSWNPTEAGIEILDWSASIETEGLSGLTDQTEPSSVSIDDVAFTDSEATVVRVVPWSAMPFSHDDYLATFDGSGTDGTAAYAGDFDGNVVLVEAPGNSADRNEIVATDAGFIAITTEFGPGEISVTGDGDVDAEPTGPAVVGYRSTDGQTWVPIALGALGEAGVWIDSVAAFDGGVLVTASDSGGEQRFFVGDADGSNMTEVDGPDVGAAWVWFASQRGGIASIIDLGSGGPVGFPSWEASFSHDGFQIELASADDGTATLVISQDGEVIHETSGDLFSFYAWTGDDSLSFLDANGESILAIPVEVAQAEIFDRENDAWTNFYDDNPYVADYRLVASRDGRAWTLIELPALTDEYGWYDQPIINGDTVLIADDSGDTIVVTLP